MHIICMSRNDISHSLQGRLGYQYSFRCYTSFADKEIILVVKKDTLCSKILKTNGKNAKKNEIG